METKTAIVRTRVEPKLKREFNSLLKKLGLSESEAVRLLMKSSVLHKKLPIELHVPNATTTKAIEEARNCKNLSKPFTNVDEMFTEILK
ncbi:MAG: type II toxin-antitoxin system RelB/DinJ family antitoxin [bacterium]